MPAVQPSIFFSKKIYSEVGGFSYDKFKICGDLDLFHRIAKIKKTKFKYLPVLTTIFMKRGNSLGDLNHGLYLKEIKDNKIPKQNLFMRVLYFISKHI